MKIIIHGMAVVFLVVSLVSCGKSNENMQAKVDVLEKRIEHSEALNSVYEHLRLASNRYRIFYLEESPAETRIEGCVCLIYKMSEFKETPESELGEIAHKQWSIFESMVAPLKDLYPKAEVKLNVYITPEFERSKLLNRTFLTSTEKPSGICYGIFVNGKFTK